MLVPGGETLVTTGTNTDDESEHQGMVGSF